MPRFRRSVLLAILPLVGLVAVPRSASAQVIRGQGVIERPVVNIIQVRTTVRAPAAVAVPGIVPSTATTAHWRAEHDAYVRDFRRIRARHLARVRDAERRAEGLARLEALATGPAAVEPLLEVFLDDDEEDVRAWLLDHLAEGMDSPVGQGTLTHLAIWHEDGEIRREAVSRLAEPAGDHARFVLDQAFRSNHVPAMERAGVLAGRLGVTEAVGDLILLQAGIYPAMRPRASLAVARFGGGGEEEAEVRFVSDLMPTDEIRGFGLDVPARTLPDIPAARPAENDEGARGQERFHARESDLHEPPPLRVALLDLAARVNGGRPIDHGRRYPDWRRWYEDVASGT